MRPTRPTDLVAVLLVLGVLTWLALRHGYGALPPLQLTLPVPVAALGAVELVVARRVRSAVRHVVDARPMTAIAIARCVALGKASALVAAGVVGVAGGLVLRTVPDVGDVRAATADLRVALATLVAAVLLCVAGVILERSGLAPRPPERSA